jgi:uncharacterized protein YecT (DUF1311 family)
VELSSESAVAALLGKRGVPKEVPADYSSHMPEKALELLKAAYREQMAWMHARAEEYETGKAQHHEMQGNAVHNKSTELAAELRHRANNLQAVIDSYERLISKP